MMEIKFIDLELLKEKNVMASHTEVDCPQKMANKDSVFECNKMMDSFGLYLKIRIGVLFGAVFPLWFTA